MTRWRQIPPCAEDESDGRTQSIMGTRAGKSMRVATLFTGVAAMTVGLTQAANAQEAAKPVAKSALNLGARIGHTIRPNVSRQSGSIQYYDDCGASRVHSNWQRTGVAFPVSPDNPDGSYGTGHSVCVGFKGALASPPGIGAYSECGGNNHGWLNGENKGRAVSFHFLPGKTYVNVDWSHLYEVVIDSWTGTDKCPQAPIDFRTVWLPGHGPMSGGGW
jgi:hypothetical protein